MSNQGLLTNDSISDGLKNNKHTPKGRWKIKEKLKLTVAQRAPEVLRTLIYRVSQPNRHKIRIVRICRHFVLTSN